MKQKDISEIGHSDKLKCVRTNKLLLKENLNANKFQSSWAPEVLQSLLLG